jgi:hypothetical protein
VDIGTLTIRGDLDLILELMFIRGKSTDHNKTRHDNPYQPPSSDDFP